MRPTRVDEEGGPALELLGLVEFELVVVGHFGFPCLTRTWALRLSLRVYTQGQ
jgi:hypothetical protein